MHENRFPSNHDELDFPSLLLFFPSFLLLQSNSKRCLSLDFPSMSSSRSSPTSSNPTSFPHFLRAAALPEKARHPSSSSPGPSTSSASPSSTNPSLSVAPLKTGSSSSRLGLDSSLESKGKLVVHGFESFEFTGEGSSPPSTSNSRRSFSSRTRWVPSRSATLWSSSAQRSASQTFETSDSSLKQRLEHEAGREKNS